MRLFCICAMLLIFSSATSVAQKRSPRLTVSEKRAVCAVAIYHVFQRNIYHRGEAREARKKKRQPTRIFIEAFDESGREVTSATLISSLRREGLNVHPAWTEKKWRRLNDPKRHIGVGYISLTRFKYLADGRIGWRVKDWSLVPSNSEYDNMLTQSSIELIKQEKHWKVVRWDVDFAAG